MALNLLHFNESKTEVLIFGPRGARDAPPLDLCSLEPYVKPTVKKLGVITDSDFKWDKQINSVTKSSFFQLRLLSKVKSFLSCTLTLAVGPECCSSSLNRSKKARAHFPHSGLLLLPSLAPCVF